MKVDHDMHARPLPQLNERDKIYFKKTPLSNWAPAVITDICDESRSYVVKTSDGEW